MTRGSKILTAAAAAALLVGGAFTYAKATGSGDDGNEGDTPISGGDLERASAAALAATGGGRVTGTEVGDEESYYEVEVTLDDGSQVDVQLDRDFQVVSSDPDHESDD